MVSTAFWHLTWKEYRANRAFWLALLALVALVEWITAMPTLTPTSPTAIYLIFSLALGAPAFFAVGSAGMAFAGEREEGTIEFLQTIPVTAKQIFASKLTVTALATLALYAVAWPIARWFTRGVLPDAKVLQELLAIWLVSAVEAIAWGTLFSLLSARPLVAITEAIFFVSAITNLLVTHSHRGPSMQPYLAIAHWRILIALVVFAVDIFLGRRWLHRGRARVHWAGIKRGKAAAPAEMHQQNVAEIAKTHESLARRHRGAMLGHLLWQEWRQSGRILIGLALMSTMLALLVRSGIAAEMRARQMSWDWLGPWILAPLLVLLAAVLPGCFVFLGDQSRRSYRFFAEHNVPPRYVWLTRQAIWLTALLITAVAVCIALVGPINFFARSIGTLASQSENHPPLEILALILLVPLLCYSAGQWASMMIRSAVLAGTIGLGLSMAICCWMALMVELKVGLIWSVAPIPVVLMVATWLRAPDWILENTRRSARARAAAILLVPGIALLVAVPIYRVQQIPLVSPGFDADASPSAITSNSAAAANLYQAAYSALVPAENPDDKHWAAKNEKAIALVLEASGYPGPVFNDPRIYDTPLLDSSRTLNGLLLASGDELQAKGKLDDALDRYIAALRMACQTNLLCPAVNGGRHGYGDEIFGRLALWGVQNGQTAARIRGAIDRLNQITTRDLQLDVSLEWWNLFARRRLLAGNDLEFDALPSKHETWESDIRSAQQMLPTERERAVRMLNILTVTAINRLRDMQFSLAGAPIVEYVEPEWSAFKGPPDFFMVEYAGSARTDQSAILERTNWLETTAPRDLGAMGRRGMTAASDFAWFETRRRATMIQLSLEAYRIDHGSFPKSLDELRGPYLHELPKDPYSGLPFRYFPNGMPDANLRWPGLLNPAPARGKSNSKRVQSDAQLFPEFANEGLAHIEPGVPGIWSTGSDLTASYESQSDGTQALKYTFRTWDDFQSKKWTVWRRGLWFPMPGQIK